jgi:asparagine synthetase B (glutamine-hydrolysing)
MFAAPRDQKIGRGDGRWLQRRAMDGILPSVVLERHVKKNFNTVLARQQRQHFHDALVGLLDRKQLLSEDFVDWEHVRTHYRSYLDGGINAWYPLFQALNVEWWMQQEL